MITLPWLHGPERGAYWRSLLYGREPETQELLQRLRLHQFIAVIGPSGSGKSSLVHAGLVPALRDSRLFGVGEWLVRTMRPGKAPLELLAAALQGDPRDPVGAARRLLAGHGARLLLVVDQLEELFTVSERGASQFQEVLLSLAKVPGCYVVVVARADFYPELMATPLWPSVRSNRMEVLPLDGDALRQAILRPAADVGVYVEPALVERLLADAIGEPGALPCCRRRWCSCGSGWSGGCCRCAPMRCCSGRRRAPTAAQTGLGCRLRWRGAPTPPWRS